MKELDTKENSKSRPKLFQSSSYNLEPLRKNDKVIKIFQNLRESGNIMDYQNEMNKLSRNSNIALPNLYFNT